MSIKVGLIGAGGIAREHLEVIRAVKGVDAVGVTSRTLARAENLAKEYNISVCTLDAASLLKQAKPDALMVLVSMDQIFKVCREVIPLGLPVFIEKPAGLLPEETRELVELANQHNVPTMVGYNRRYYSIFHKGLNIIRRNGKLMGVRVEGHERFWKLTDELKEPVRSNWIYANNTHMIDLLRFFGGEPKEMHALSQSRIEENGDQFAAVMELESGAIGSFNAHWYSPGGWGVTLYGEGATVEFKPLENGRWIDREFKSYDIEPDEVDVKYKAGFYAQMKAFVSLVRERQLSWPGMDLKSAHNTMELARQISNRKVTC